MTSRTHLNLAFAFTVAAITALAQASPVIYEPFADSNSSLGGNTPGTGLTGTWSGGGSNPSIIANQTYGSLPTSGNGVSVTSGWTNNQVLIDTTNPQYTALLSDGGDMWFSILFRGNVDSASSVFSRFAFALGTSNFTSNGDLASGTAIGFASATSQRLYAGLWETTNWGTTNLGGPPETAVDTSTFNYTANQTYLVVGHAHWGTNNATDDDVVTLYLPGTDLALGSAVASSSGITNQSTFDRLMTHNGNVVTTIFDEIRIGATYADLVPVPEPASLALLGFGGLMMIKRRRA